MRRVKMKNKTQAFIYSDWTGAKRVASYAAGGANSTSCSVGTTTQTWGYCSLDSKNLGECDHLKTDYNHPNHISTETAYKNVRIGGTDANPIYERRFI